jgi:hypothetical protein
MIDKDDARRLYLRDSAMADIVVRQDSDPPVGAPSLLVRTTLLSVYPTAPGSYFACQPLTLLGAEVEGGQAAIFPGYSTFFALNLGSSVPPPGTQILTTFVGNRWVFRYDA